MTASLGAIVAFFQEPMQPDMQYAVTATLLEHEGTLVPFTSTLYIPLQATSPLYPKNLSSDKAIK